MDSRDKSGKFKKGHSGNPNGRPAANIRLPKNKKKDFIVRTELGRFAPGHTGNPGSSNSDKIYIVWCEGDYYKIGVCKDPRARMAMLLSNMPYRAEMIYVRKVKNAVEIEQSIHAMFSNCRIRGEWFRLFQADVDYIQRYIEEMSSQPITVEQLCLIHLEGK